MPFVGRYRHAVSGYLGRAALQARFQAGGGRGAAEGNLAAGILRLTGWKPGEEALCDPMCGSGTFLIEAAQMALDVAPGLGRHFAFERFKHFERDTWLADPPGRRRPPAARRDRWRSMARTSSRIRCARLLSICAAPGWMAAWSWNGWTCSTRKAPAASGVLVANPPYGVRLSDTSELEAFYPKLGDASEGQLDRLALLLLHRRPAAAEGRAPLKASKRTPLFNGAIECRLFEYLMVAGSAASRSRKGIKVTRTGCPAAGERPELRREAQPYGGEHRSCEIGLRSRLTGLSNDVQVLDAGQHVPVAALALELDLQAQVVHRSRRCAGRPRR